MESFSYIYNSTLALAVNPCFTSKKKKEKKKCLHHDSCVGCVSDLCAFECAYVVLWRER